MRTWVKEVAAPSGVTTFANDAEAALKIPSPLALANSRDQTTSLEWSRRMAPLKPYGGRHMHAACWLLAHISKSPGAKKPPHGWQKKENPHWAGLMVVSRLQLVLKRFYAQGAFL